MTYKFGIPSTPAGTVTDVGGVQSTDASTGVVFSVTLNTAGTNTLENPTNLQEGQKYTWQLKQDAVTPVDVTFGTDFLFTGGTAPTITQVAGAVDIVRATALDTGSGTKLYCEFEADVKQPSTFVLPDNLNHWWKMNGGNTTSIDEGTTAVARKNLSLTSVTTVTNGNRTSNEDVNAFNGSTAYGKAGSGIEDSTMISPVTYSFWLKLTSTPSDYNHAFGSASGGSFQYGMGMYYIGGDMRFWSSITSPSAWASDYASIASSSTSDGWVHYACVLDTGSSVRQIYKDGVAGTNNGNINTPTFPLGSYYFGVGSLVYGTGGSAYGYMPCEISDFRVYDVALSASEVATIAAGDWP